MLSLKKNQSVIFIFSVPAYNNVSFFLSSISTPCTSILLNKLKSTCFISTFVFNSLDKVCDTFLTSQFCTGFICNMPQVEKARSKRKRKKAALCLVFLNRRPHAKAQPVNKIEKINIETGKIKMNKRASSSQNSSDSKTHFDMLSSLCRVNY